MNACIHHIDGRLRIRLPALKNSPAAAIALVDKISAIDGVGSVTTNRHTCSVVICYDPQRIGARHVREALASITGGLQMPAAPAGGAASAFADKLATTLLEKIIARSALALVGALL